MAEARLSASAARVQAALAARGFALAVVELPDSTRSAADAAAAIGCAAAAIVKTLVFRCRASERAVVALASGVDQVDTARLGALVGETVERADAEFVRAATGFAIGGVAPLGYPQPLAVLIDRRLVALPTVWAAAGTPHAVFSLPGAALPAVSGGRVADISRGS